MNGRRQYRCRAEKQIDEVAPHEVSKHVLLEEGRRWANSFFRRVIHQRGRKGATEEAVGKTQTVAVGGAATLAEGEDGPADGA